jgi:hypothetical protein
MLGPKKTIPHSALPAYEEQPREDDLGFDFGILSKWGLMPPIHGFASFALLSLKSDAVNEF